MSARTAGVGLVGLAIGAAAGWWISERQRIRSNPVSADERPGAYRAPAGRSFPGSARRIDEAAEDALAERHAAAHEAAVDRLSEVPGADGIPRDELSAELARLRAVVSGRMAGGGLVQPWTEGG